MTKGRKLDVESMSAPVSRGEFERNMWLLKESIDNRRLQFAPHIAVDGLFRVRTLPNGRLDMLSVDETTRLQANMLANMPFGPLGMALDDSGADEDE